MQITGSGLTISSSAAYTADYNRIASVTDALGKVTKYSYNENTNALEWVQYPKDSETTRTTSYTYDALGRVSQRVSGTASGNVVTETFTYTAPSASATSGQVATMRVRGTGLDITYTYTYDANGNPLTTTGTLATTLGTLNPLRYRGYVYDQETGIYYVCNRYYIQNTGRFLNADILISTGQGIGGNNMFAYYRNNPVI